MVDDKTFEVIVKEVTRSRLTVTPDRITIKIPDNSGTVDAKRMTDFLVAVANHPSVKEQAVVLEKLKGRTRVPPYGSISIQMEDETRTFKKMFWERDLIKCEKRERN